MLHVHCVRDVWPFAHVIGAVNLSTFALECLRRIDERITEIIVAVGIGRIADVVVLSGSMISERSQ